MPPVVSSSSASPCPSSSLRPRRPRARTLRAPRRLAVAEAAAVPAAVSLAAGTTRRSASVSHPLDTLKTKMDRRPRGRRRRRHRRGAAPALGPLGVASAVLREEGLVGHGGVVPTMAGQAIIKGVLFFVYDAAKAVMLALSAGGAPTDATAAAAREPEPRAARRGRGAGRPRASSRRRLPCIKVVMQAAPGRIRRRARPRERCSRRRRGLFARSRAASARRCYARCRATCSFRRVRGGSRRRACVRRARAALAAPRPASLVGAGVSDRVVKTNLQSTTCAGRGRAGVRDAPHRAGGVESSGRASARRCCAPS